MTSRVQAALVATAAASSRKVPHSIHAQRHGSSAPGIHAGSQQKQSFSSVYSIRQGTGGTTADPSYASHTDRFQAQKMLVIILIRKIFNILLVRYESYD